MNREICNSDPSRIGTSLTQAKSSQSHPPPSYSTESYSLASEVVTCHADQGWTDTVVLVVRQSSPTTSGGQLSSTSKHQRIKSAAILEALVFECLGGEAEATAITRLVKDKLEDMDVSLRFQTRLDRGGHHFQLEYFKNYLVCD